MVDLLPEFKKRSPGNQDRAKTNRNPANIDSFNGWLHAGYYPLPFSKWSVKRRTEIKDF